MIKRITNSQFHTSCVRSAKNVDSTPNHIKKMVQREKKLRQYHKQDVTKHPLHLELPVALKLIRAAEVGQPSLKTTIAVQMVLVPEKGAAPLSGTINFPRPLKDSKMIVLTLDEQIAQDCLKKGAVNAGGLDLVQQIEAGSIDLKDITHIFADTAILKDLKNLGKILGPKNLMPSIKKKTASEDPLALMTSNLGSTPFKQKGNQVSVPIARCDFSDKQIIENLQAAAKSIYGSQPAGAKKTNTLGLTRLTSTIGPAVLVDFKSLST